MKKRTPCMAIEFLCVTKHGAVIEADRHSETPTGSASFKCQTGVSPTAQVFQVRRLPEHANIARCKHPCSSWRGKKPMGVWSWGLSPPWFKRNYIRMANGSCYRYIIQVVRFAFLRNVYYFFLYFLFLLFARAPANSWLYFCPYCYHR